MASKRGLSLLLLPPLKLAFRFRRLHIHLPPFHLFLAGLVQFVRSRQGCAPVFLVLLNLGTARFLLPPDSGFSSTRTGFRRLWYDLRGSRCGAGGKWRNVRWRPGQAAGLRWQSCGSAGATGAVGRAEAAGGVGAADPSSSKMSLG